MTARRRVAFLGLALLALSGCKARKDTGGSESLSIQEGQAKYWTFKSDGNFQNITFWGVNPVTGDVSLDPQTRQPNLQGPTYPISGGLSSHLIIGSFPRLEADSSVSYGFNSRQTPWTCQQAYQLVNEQLDGTAADASAPTDRCQVEISTEDALWFTISITNTGPQGSSTDSYQTNSNLVVPPNAYTSAPSAGHLQPFRHINVTLHNDVLAAMQSLDRQYQTNASQKTERDTCLRNSRTHKWLDIQGHFYCILPYNPHRSCYSNRLIQEAAIVPTLPPAQQPGRLMQAMTTSYSACFTTTGESGKHALTPAEGAAFQYVMFTKTGLLDFSVESQNSVINAFYQGKRPPETRPRRVTDPIAGWQANQRRYDVIRQMQLGGLAQARALLGAPGGAQPPAAQPPAANPPSSSGGDDDEGDDDGGV